VHCGHGGHGARVGRRAVPEPRDEPLEVRLVAQLDVLACRYFTEADLAVVEVMANGPRGSRS
jgi:hypothetical protein